MANALQVGIVWINCSQPTFVQAPWGGVKVCELACMLSPILRLLRIKRSSVWQRSTLQGRVTCGATCVAHNYSLPQPLACPASPRTSFHDVASPLRSLLDLLATSHTIVVWQASSNLPCMKTKPECRVVEASMLNFHVRCRTADLGGNWGSGERTLSCLSSRSRSTPPMSAWTGTLSCPASSSAGHGRQARLRVCCLQLALA